MYNNNNKLIFSKPKSLFDDDNDGGGSYSISKNKDGEHPLIFIVSTKTMTLIQFLMKTKPDSLINVSLYY